MEKLLFSSLHSVKFLLHVDSLLPGKLNVVSVSGFLYSYFQLLMNSIMSKRS